MQPVPDENHSTSSGEVEADAPHGGNLAVVSMVITFGK
jgi:hypothetical protein